MRDGRLHRAIRNPVGDRLRHIGKLHVDDISAKRAHDVDRLLQYRLCCKVHTIAVPDRVETDPQALHSLFDRSQIIGHRIE